MAAAKRHIDSGGCSILASLPLVPVLVTRKRGRRLMRATAGSGHAVKPASHPQGFGLDGAAGGQQKGYQAVGSSRGCAE